jgi:hypothetical protein
MPDQRFAKLVVHFAATQGVGGTMPKGMKDLCDVSDPLLTQIAPKPFRPSRNACPTFVRGNEREQPRICSLTPPHVIDERQEP